MQVIPNTISLAVLTALKASGGVLNGCKLGLFQNNLTPTVATALGDLVEADYTGYALSAGLTWGTPFIDPVNGPAIMAASVSFHADTPFLVPNTIYGYYLVNSAGTSLIAAERFVDPVIIDNENAQIVIVPAFGAISQAAA